MRSRERSVIVDGPIEGHNLSALHGTEEDFRWFGESRDLPFVESPRGGMN